MVTDKVTMATTHENLEALAYVLFFCLSCKWWLVFGFL